MAHVVAAREVVELHRGEGGPIDHGLATDRLVDFTVGGLRAGETR